MIDNSNLRFIRVEEGDKVEIFKTHIIKTEEMIKIDIDQTMQIGEFKLVDRVEVDQGMNKIIGEEILEAI